MEKIDYSVSGLYKTRLTIFWAGGGRSTYSLNSTQKWISNKFYSVTRVIFGHTHAGDSTFISEVGPSQVLFTF